VTCNASYTLSGTAGASGTTCIVGIDFGKGCGEAGVVNWGSMGSFTTSQCDDMDEYNGTEIMYNGSNLGSANTVCLTDERNSQVYRVRKMPDGKCWMLDNLKYASGAYIDAASTTVKITVTGVNGGNSFNYCTTPGSGTTNYSTSYQDGYWPKSTTGCGYLYAWQTAITGDGNSGTYGTGTDGHTYTTSMICPTGWTLPANGVYGVLDTAIKTWISNNPDGLKYGGASAFQLPYAGYYYGSSFSSQGSSGRYWSSTESSSDGAYNLYFGSSGALSTSSHSSKDYYFAVRCYR
jgi:uncharacterized protein (TIGR02145 family)